MSIAIGEIVRLLKQAEKAIKAKDDAQLESINIVLGTIGYTVIIKDGKPYVKQGLPTTHIDPSRLAEEYRKRNSSE